MQLHLVDGRLGKDAEVKTDKNGRSYVRFSLANRVFKNGEEDTVWYDVISYNEMIVTKQAPYLKKGGLVFVTGTLSVDTRTVNSTIYTNLTLRADKVDFIGGGKSDDNGAQTTAVAQPTVSVAETIVSNDAPATVFTAQVPSDAVAAPSGATLVDDAEDDLPF